MKLCRFDDDRLGVVTDRGIADVTAALDVLPAVRWPIPPGDLLIVHLDAVRSRAEAMLADAALIPTGTVRFLSPVANPPRIIAAPVNYRKHQAEANADGGVNFDADVKAIDHYGLFLKSNTSLVGFGEGVEIAFPERRTDHEIELVAVIGKEGRDIAASAALGHIAGYALGLDITLRGPEDRSLRKSLDSFSVLGPWLTTSDEVPDPDALECRLTVNGELRQSANTRDLIFGVARLIEYASAHYRLMPGDLIYTGTPEGVGPILPGDLIACAIDGVGAGTVAVHAKQ